ncbi:MAG: chorismate--pyruvate lyase [Lachnospiraceae bacterium]|nr:chorismate--pyruvate lyase [Lachnospiraceae bacterium]
MLTCDYRVVRIDGDYAGLLKLDSETGAPQENGELNFVARALLPENITEGCRLHYEMLTYTLIEE